MDAIAQAKSQLTEAEASLRVIMQNEVAAGRYGSLAELASLADRLAALAANEVEQRGSGGHLSENGEGVGLRGDADGAKLGPKRKSGGRAAHRGATPKPRSAGTKRQGKELRRGRSYPYFEATAEGVTKVGWSKKHKREYRHYAPASAAVAFGAHVDLTQTPSRVWSVEDLGVIVDQDDGDILPAYQVYLIIAWMRSIGLVIKQGRSGYVIAGSRALGGEMRKAFKS